MSEKAVLLVIVDGNHVNVTQKDGTTRRVPLTEKIKRKMDGIGSAYFYGRVRPDGVSLDRFAPVSAWQEAA